MTMRLALMVVMGMLLQPAPAAHAQMLGLPVAQNAFVNPGVTVAGNYGTGERGHTFGGAAAWAPGSRLMVAGGAGVFNPDVADVDGGFTWGTRAAFSLPFTRPDGPLGVAVFAGLGGGSVGDATEFSVPFGASVGYRIAIGEQRGVSAYAAPLLRWTRVTMDDETVGGTQARASVGFDVALLPALGFSFGYEFGADAEDGEPGPTGPLLGIGISWAFRR